MYLTNKHTFQLRTSSADTSRSDEDDVMQAVLLKNKIMEEKSGRKHSLFTNLEVNPLADLDRKKMYKCMNG